MGKFDDLAAAVASFGGNNKVIFDDVEMPSIMVGIPKMKYSDLITGGTDDVLDVFKVDGVERDILYISKYLNIVVGDRAYSLPMKDPKRGITFDQAVAACRSKGAGWGLTPNGLWGAIMLWCNRNGFLPRGNTDYGKSSKKHYENGIVSYYDALNKKNNKTFTGSGPATWYHDGTFAGIADICGNLCERVAGLRLVNCEIQIIPEGNCMKTDCDMSANSAEWRAIMPNGTLVIPGTEGALHYDRINDQIVISDSATDTSLASNIFFKQLKAKEGINIPQILIANGLMMDANDIYAYDEAYHMIHNGPEKLATRGDAFNSGSAGSIGGLGLMYDRTDTSSPLGFRCAYDEKLAAGN